MSAAELIIARLRDLKFRVRMDHVDLFGTSLPLLKAIAVDDRAHQLVLVAEQEMAGPIDDCDSEYDQRWRELLFAVSGLRHQLRGPRFPALSAPIILALVDAAGASRLRDLVEDIAENFALFSRIDINVLDYDEIDWREPGGDLDFALASLLPCVRHAVENDVTVAAQDVEHFWERLGLEVGEAAAALSGDFDKATAGQTASDVMTALQTGDVDESAAVRTARPLSQLKLKSFRSFEEADLSLGPATIVHGANGSGKSSLCEALEILWAGRTQRIPERVTPKEYAKHLNRDGKPFILSGKLGWGEDDESVSADAIEERAGLPLGRTVLAQHALTEMASGTPKSRFRAFLDASGLDLPELDKKIDELRRAAYEKANEALGEAGIARLEGVNRNGLQHLRGALHSGFAAELPPSAQLEGAVDLLNQLTGGAFAPRRLVDSTLAPLLANVDSAVYRVHLDLDKAPTPEPQIKEALLALHAAADRLRAAADPLRLLTQQLSRAEESRAKRRKPKVDSAPPPMPAATAARWLSHVRGLERSVVDLTAQVGYVEDSVWRRRLEQYIESLRKTIERASVQKLEDLALDRDAVPMEAVIDGLDPALLEKAGFVRSPEPSSKVLAAMKEMQARLAEQAARLDELAAKLERHPARSFVSRAARIMPALCHFELARELTKPKGAVTRAQETLVSELLDERLFPVVKELVAALVRFEWYFEPLQIKVDGRGLRLSGGANRDPEQDVRLLLNAAERKVVGIAWFLALHILQPPEDRQVLVMDDSAEGFDSVNMAAFIATLRSVVRLLKPAQLVITTHDDTMVALLEQEFAAVDGWPAEIGLLRCRRTGSGASDAFPADRDDGRPSAADLQAELRKLALATEDSPARA